MRVLTPLAVQVSLRTLGLGGLPAVKSSDLSALEKVRRCLRVNVHGMRRCGPVPMFSAWVCKAHQGQGLGLVGLFELVSMKLGTREQCKLGM